MIKYKITVQKYTNLFTGGFYSVFTLKIRLIRIKNSFKNPPQVSYAVTEPLGFKAAYYASKHRIENLQEDKKTT